MRSWLACLDGQFLSLGPSIWEIQSLMWELTNTYGETRYAKPSGRCSDGFIIPDLINKALGLPFSRPFLGLKVEDQVFPSINFASDGSGLLNSTHSDWGVVPFSEQLKQIREFSMKISKKNLIVVISSGGNDIAANLQNIMDVDLEGMLMSLEKRLQQLYEYGVLGR
ncbi:GDSL esterase/lipase 6-like [Selaginella moellendorffii]|uniref:GDSL esterase/lipase 6-like n=1 Tax=Selaginella moellendorffii TaxID=88036 RepID=UPI000D1CA472|nr:GDSL esterase/lipase 6-like [Selaginella moellendorffii]|eukprot:XP_024527275.1 GDSL esterase/lipase 6-like [Selaginella moellendorffii]